MLQANIKAGGVNRIFEKSNLLPSHLFNSLMLVGIDVNHPGLIEKIPTSIASAVGTTDRTFARYFHSIRVQPNERKEIILDIGNMIGELLANYKSQNQAFPNSLVIFRDGVSDGQFNAVKQQEYNQKIVPVLAKFYGPGLPKVTLIVVQKRHHIRFALPETFGNVESGTVVDSGIVDPSNQNFFLNSHFSPLVRLCHMLWHSRLI